LPFKCNLQRYTEEGLSEEQQREWDERLRRVHKTTLEDLRATLRGSMSMGEYVKSSHFDGYLLEDFTPLGKDFTHPVDYLVPVSVHSVAVADCRALAADLEKVAKTKGKGAGAERGAAEGAEGAEGGGGGGGGAGGGGLLNYPYAAVIYEDDVVEFGGTNFYLFIGPEKSRAYPVGLYKLNPVDP
jgi:hypothetical protein